MDSSYQGETIYVDEENDVDNWQCERDLLKQQIKQLEHALVKSKKLHRTFAEDVIESEDIRNREFDRVKKELIAVNKRQSTEIRQLTKDKCFYESTCTELLKEKELISNADNSSQSTSVLKFFVSAECSTANRVKLTTWRQRSSSDLKSKTSRNASNLKISTKLFEDNKKLKEKVSKLTRSNANLRLQVKQLENFKSKIQVKKQQQVADQRKLQDLLKSITRTNSQTFNKFVLSQLDQFNRIEPNNEVKFR